MKKHNQISQAQSILDLVAGKEITKQELLSKTAELAKILWIEKQHSQTRHEYHRQKELAEMMNDSKGKAFTVAMIDQCFRANSPERIADQLIYLLQKYGVPHYLPFQKRVRLISFKQLGHIFAKELVPFMISFIQKDTASFVIPAEGSTFLRHLKKRKKQGIQLNINYLGEAVLSETEVEKRLDIYFDLLSKEDVECVSIKISTLFSQINLLATEKTLQILSERLQQLYRIAQLKGKFVYLDMEEYCDLYLTKELFQRVLSLPEFKNFSAGIALQAYIPESYQVQKELTDWAIQRVNGGGEAVKIRLVKGANLAMEKQTASIKNWPQTPYHNKQDTDANYKKMVCYGLQPKHAKAVSIGIASHNVFDIAFAIILRSINQVESSVSFEMLEGMENPLSRVVTKLTGKVLLYCPIAKKQDFKSAIGYLIRRLDENTGEQNFLRHSFDLEPDSDNWNKQLSLFTQSYHEQKTVQYQSNRNQNRCKVNHFKEQRTLFRNESDTDFSIQVNRKWANTIIEQWRKQTPIQPPQMEWSEITHALESAKQQESTWNKQTIQDRCQIISLLAHLLREKRSVLIGMMMLEAKKTFIEADAEVSEAIDFAEYYIHIMLTMKEDYDLSYHSLGTILITPPWNFPVAISCGGIIAALITGNCVLFKPAPETAWIGQFLVPLFHKAGIPKHVLHYIHCNDEPLGSQLIQDERIDAVILTGSTTTAEHFLKLRSNLRLFAETGGKNTIIVTALADRDLAIKHIIQSAFSHSGQKCSAASLLICEAEVYDDPSFMSQLEEAVLSLKDGSVWELDSIITPLIQEPNPIQLKALTQLEYAEEWLVQPKQDLNDPHLWSAGVKVGVQRGSFSHQTEFFIPLLSVIRANDLEHAIQIANDTEYGLTSGLQSLDEREQKIWKKRIIAGNIYINRPITGAIVKRQPFGGCKKSSFGQGFKAGGSNYLSQFLIISQKTFPTKKADIHHKINKLTRILKRWKVNEHDMKLWYASLADYSYWQPYFTQKHDESKVRGQDNTTHYIPLPRIGVRITEDDKAVDFMRIIVAILLFDNSPQISWDGKKFRFPLIQPKDFQGIPVRVETEEGLAQQIRLKQITRLRMLSKPSDLLTEVCSKSACYIDQSEVLGNGRYELPRYLQEITTSTDYHRYGNISDREQ
ncbi:MAG: RHH-type proline utilization regulon transcriptional repressor/proline dehydrogenase [bacterium]|jgi:RHH-type proline utilization regulon transcriptional repressor/proline dehydrogenase/delta 1-pyrroline-5-carboxylate dehydrogenase